MSQTYTDLPYVFDLMYDIKTVESLHDHLLGRRRLATSGTDAQLVEMAREHEVPLPEGLPHTLTTFPKGHAEALMALEEIYKYVHSCSPETPLDANWLKTVAATALAKNSITVGD